MDQEKVEELAVGARAPEFRLASSQGGEVSLAEVCARANVVLFFVREFI